jgi:two-component sensor histidine kinase
LIKNNTFFKSNNIFVCLFFIIFSSFTYSQEAEFLKFNNYYKSSKKLNRLSQFSNSINDLKKAIEIAKRNNWEKEYLEVSVFLGEMMRRTADHKKGLKILEKLENTKKYPRIHANKLGRMAALYAEGGVFNGISKIDSIRKHLRIGLKIAKENNFYYEEAIMSNELGLHTLNTGKKEDAMKALLRSAKLFKQIKDNNNYVVVMTHVLKIKTIEKKLIEASKIAVELLELVKNNKWFGAEQSLYRYVARMHLAKNDSISYYKWMTKEKHAACQLLEARTSQELSYYRINFETNKFKNEATFAKADALKKSSLLDEQKKVTIFLSITIFIFFVLIIIVYTLFKNKNKLTKSLEISNQKFELLMTESNHRIKNNLQMILSMVDYSSDNGNKQEAIALSKISGKIETVSVLHKHLYADVHNQFVNIETYFNEITHLYAKMNAINLVISSSIFPIKINSERIVYFGLILNELLANTIEHNLSEIKNVTIEITEHLDKFQFLYSDNSPHLNSNLANKGSLLLNQLVIRVKGEDFNIDKSIGTYKFLFKDVE